VLDDEGSGDGERRRTDGIGKQVGRGYGGRDGLTEVRHDRGWGPDPRLGELDRPNGEAGGGRVGDALTRLTIRPVMAVAVIVTWRVLRAGAGRLSGGHAPPRRWGCHDPIPEAH
jgi:hypothetical protein